MMHTSLLIVAMGTQRTRCVLVFQGCHGKAAQTFAVVQFQKLRVQGKVATASLLPESHKKSMSHTFVLLVVYWSCATLPSFFHTTPVLPLRSLQCLPVFTLSFFLLCLTLLLNGHLFFSKGQQMDQMRHPPQANIISSQLYLKEPHFQVRPHHKELYIKTPRNGFWRDTIQVMEKPPQKYSGRSGMCLRGDVHLKLWTSNDFTKQTLALGLMVPIQNLSTKKVKKEVLQF